MWILRWIGKQKARGIAALVFISVLTPPLGAIFQPYVTEAVFGLLCISFVRIDFTQCRHYLRRPGLILGAIFWTSVLVPLLAIFVLRFMGVNITHPDLSLGITLQVVASPMMATPAIATLMGLDATLVLVTLVASTSLVPLTAPLLFELSGISLEILPWQLGMKLVGLILGSVCIGLFIRRWMGPAKVVKLQSELDGINILLLFVFISAVMGQLGIRFITEPMLMLSLTLTTFALFFTLFFTTYVLFLTSGKEQAFSLALMTSQRNMGLMVAAAGGVLPDTAWLYFAVSQFPIYFAPYLLHPALVFIRR